MNAPTVDALLARARRAAHTATTETLHELASAFTALDTALTAGAVPPRAWAASTDAAAVSGWRAALRNSAGHTIAVAHLDTRLTFDDVHTRVITDMAVYCTWLVADARITHALDRHASPVVVPNPVHERTRAELAAHTHPAEP